MGVVDIVGGANGHFCRWVQPLRANAAKAVGFRDVVEQRAIRRPASLVQCSRLLRDNDPLTLERAARNVKWCDDDAIDAGCPDERGSERGEADPVAVGREPGARQAVGWMCEIDGFLTRARVDDAEGQSARVGAFRNQIQKFLAVR